MCRKISANIYIYIYCIALFIVMLYPLRVESGDSTSYNPTSISIKSTNTGIPVGTIIVWSQATDPKDADKWLDCDGRAVDSKKYPLLYAMMHNTPNYTSRFVRAGGKDVAGNVAEDSIKTHSVTIPPHTHTFDLKANGTMQTVDKGESVYVPKLSGADDSLSTERVEKVKSTIEYVCGMHEEEYECNCVEAKTETYQCGIDPSTKRFGRRAQCYLMEYCGNYSYGAAGSFETYCDSEDKVQRCCVEERNRRYPAGSGYVYNEGATYECSISVSSSYAVYDYNYKYCTRTIPRTCETCKKTVEDYCTKDIYIDKIEYGEKTPTAELSTLTSSVKTLNNGSVSGIINSSGELTGTYTGASETAPKHVYARYLIRAKN